VSADLECSEVGDARDLRHQVLHLVGFLLQRLQVRAKELDCQLALDATDRLFHVVRDRLREIPVHTRELAQLGVHRGNEIVFRLELRAPFGMRQQINKKLGIVEATGVTAVVRAALLADNLCDFRKSGESQSRLFCERDAGRWSGARRQRATNPNCALIQVRQEFGANNSAKSQKQHDRKGNQPQAQSDSQVVNAENFPASCQRCLGNPPGRDLAR